MVRYGRRKIGRTFFHKRYFVLEPLVLAYYKRKPSDKEVHNCSNLDKLLLMETCWWQMILEFRALINSFLHISMQL